MYNNIHEVGMWLHILRIVVYTWTLLGYVTGTKFVEVQSSCFKWCKVVYIFVPIDIIFHFYIFYRWMKMIDSFEDQVISFNI